MVGLWPHSVHFKALNGDVSGRACWAGTRALLGPESVVGDEAETGKGEKDDSKGEVREVREVGEVAEDDEVDLTGFLELCWRIGRAPFKRGIREDRGVVAPAPASMSSVSTSAPIWSL